MDNNCLKFNFTKNFINNFYKQKFKKKKKKKSGFPPIIVGNTIN